MDYIVNIPEVGQIVFEQSNYDEVKKNTNRRLLAYYVALLAPKINSNLSDTDKIKLLIRIAGTLSEEDIMTRIRQFENENKKAGFIDVLQELLDAYEDEDLEQYVDVEINGNVFTYQKKIDISPFQELFENVGKDVRGKRWMVEIDSDGKVVLHE